mmetsp:Transcript_4008/g.11311  ORF Transcript_4008/g.11311 Transcript_4008/m.11311 type:complete len:528 (+) Transcript_4008:3436-5019(+)
MVLASFSRSPIWVRVHALLHSIFSAFSSHSRRHMAARRTSTLGSSTLSLSPLWRRSRMSLRQALLEMAAVESRTKASALSRSSARATASCRNTRLALEDSSNSSRRARGGLASSTSRACACQLEHCWQALSSSVSMGMAMCISCPSAWRSSSPATLTWLLEPAAASAAASSPDGISFLTVATHLLAADSLACSSCARGISTVWLLMASVTTSSRSARSGGSASSSSRTFRMASRRGMTSLAAATPSRSFLRPETRAGGGSTNTIASTSSSEPFLLVNAWHFLPHAKASCSLATRGSTSSDHPHLKEEPSRMRSLRSVSRHLPCSRQLCASLIQALQDASSSQGRPSGMLIIGAAMKFAIIASLLESTCLSLGKSSSSSSAFASSPAGAAASTSGGSCRSLLTPAMASPGSVVVTTGAGLSSFASAGAEGTVPLTWAAWLSITESDSSSSFALGVALSSAMAVTKGTSAGAAPFSCCSSIIPMSEDAAASSMAVIPQRGLLGSTAMGSAWVSSSSSSSLGSSRQWRLV